MKNLIRPAGSLAFIMLLTFVVTGCGDNGGRDGGQDDAVTPAPRDRDVGSPRSFLLGLSSFPRESTDESYKQAFSLAGEVGEMILIQRSPPWSEFIPGGTLSKDTQDATQQEKALAENNGLDIFFAIDATDPADRGRLQDLPDSLAGKGFADQGVREGFLAYVKYVALNYKPRYLALGIEVNMYFERQPGDFDSFLSVYFEAYDAVKEASPETLVFPTFQLEAMQGMLPGASPPSPEWALLERFEPKIDVAAFSSYPSFVFDSPESISKDYFAEIKRHTDRPIAVAASGYSSGPGRDGVNEGTESEQAVFVQRVLMEAERLGMLFVVWSAGCDPAVPGSPPFDLYDHIGLCRSDGSHKPAWIVWSTQAARPVDVG